MGRFAKVMNKVPAAILRSPLHLMMSNKYLLLAFTGHKSGRRYTTPVAYLREGDAFLMTTDSPWWKNLRGGAPVKLRVRGQEYEGTGEAITDETEVVRLLGKFLETQPGYGKFVGVSRDAGGRVDPSKLEEAARGRVVVRIWPKRATGGSRVG
jgi:F420H(2)-dependent quinone reductase